MQRPMCPVVECIFHDEEQGDLPGHGGVGGEGDVGAQTEVVDYGVEEVDLREFDREVLEEDVFCTLPLIGWCGDLCLRRLTTANGGVPKGFRGTGVRGD